MDHHEEWSSLKRETIIFYFKKEINILRTFMYSIFEFKQVKFSKRKSLASKSAGKSKWKALPCDQQVTTAV